MECPKTTFAFKVVLQVLLVFCGLTLFYYNYVINVEKADFANQLNIVVERLLGDKTQYAFMNDTPNHKISSRGVLESTKEKQIISLVDSTLATHESNSLLLANSMKLLVEIVVVLVIIVILIWYFVGCVNIKDELFQAFIIIVAIIITEFTFLITITKNYIAADPNGAVRTLCQTVIANTP